MSEKMDGFLAVDKNLLGKGLQPIDILILAQIQEFERSNECYVTNQQFAEWFGVSTKTIERALDRLEELKYISRDTKTIGDNGQKSKQRKLKTEKATDILTLPSEKQPSFCPEATVKMSESNRQNDAIKENLKDNLKENLLRENANAKRKRELEDLTDEELDNLLKRYRAKEKYAVLQKDFSLQYGILSKELPSQINSIIKERKDKKKREESMSIIETELQSNPTLIDDISALLGLSRKEVESIIPALSVSLEDVYDYLKDEIDWKEYYNNPEHELYVGNKSYLEFIQEIIKTNVA